MKSYKYSIFKVTRFLFIYKWFERTMELHTERPIRCRVALKFWGPRYLRIEIWWLINQKICSYWIWVTHQISISSSFIGFSRFGQKTIESISWIYHSYSRYILQIDEVSMSFSSARYQHKKWFSSPSNHSCQWFQYSYGYFNQLLTNNAYLIYWHRSVSNNITLMQIHVCLTWTWFLHHFCRNKFKMFLNIG